MAPLGDHQLYVGLSGSADHLSTFAVSHGHWLFAQDVNASASGPLRGFAMHAVREGNIHSVNVTLA